MVIRNKIKKIKYNLRRDYIDNKKDYIKHIVHYLHTTSGSLNREELNKLCSYVFSNDMEIEFTDFDIEAVNNHIKDNNYQSFFSLMEEKKEMLKDVVCNMVYSNVDSLTQYITDSVYDNWNNSVMSREDFIKQLSNYEKVAVMFSNFNYQFEDGGLYQWYDNGYYDDLDFLISFLEKSNYSRKNEFSEILEYINHIHDSIENLDSYDDWYEEDVQTRLDSFKYLDNDYERLRESWRDYLEEYLYDNLPKEYLNKIMKLEMKENNISI